MVPIPSERWDQAASMIAAADGLLISAGAGMGVDSGLPDFRGDQGFWQAYPAYAHLGLRFQELAQPRWFHTDPALAWGFYGHRRNLYRSTPPHPGYELLRRWASDKPHGAFVFTSNIDGHFQQAGFREEQILECHGTLAWNQCRDGCAGLFPAESCSINVDPLSFRAAKPWPSCPRCGALARPNVLMFGDDAWQSQRTLAQEVRLRAWLECVRRPVIIECGAGTAIPTVRCWGDRLAAAGVPLIRINPREAEVSAGGISLPRGALDGLTRIATALANLQIG